MLADRGLCYLIQLAHGLLRHPDRIFRKVDINFRVAFFILINQNFSGIGQFVIHNPSSSKYFAICACTPASSASMLAMFCFTSSISTSSSSSKVSTYLGIFRL